MEGLLRGPLLMTAYRMVFISPTSASFDTSEGRGTRSGNAALHGMTSVNDASIAYVAAQLFFSLSSKATFTKNKDNGAIEFYTSIRAFFMDPDFKVDVEELLQWWNEQIFPNVIVVDNAAGMNHHLV
ncbi:hypothetical protein QCA50_012569 [Cerrena zonata]|uniref:Uncharacterized protein n=1 Tax=Cerrena zonata TaxID=2478898 RepID=A0AAW0FZG4_9APHY